MYPIKIQNNCITLGIAGVIRMNLQFNSDCHVGIVWSVILKLSVKITPNIYAHRTPRTTEICGYIPNLDRDYFGVI